MRRVLECLTDPHERYRYRLCVEMLPAAASPRPHLAVIQKNPSTADAARRDPTVGKVEAWARRRGFARVTYLNLFAWRSPHPRRLNALPYVDAVGAENDAVIWQTVQAVVDEAGTVAVGWGNPNGLEATRYRQRIDEVMALLGGRALYAVGPLTQQGQPRHGLHWNGDLPLVAWIYKSS